MKLILSPTMARKADAAATKRDPGGKPRDFFADVATVVAVKSVSVPDTLPLKRIRSHDEDRVTVAAVSGDVDLDTPTTKAIADEITNRVGLGQVAVIMNGKTAAARVVGSHYSYDLEPKAPESHVVHIASDDDKTHAAMSAPRSKISLKVTSK